jgi:hypothetical protein
MGDFLIANTSDARPSGLNTYMDLAISDSSNNFAIVWQDTRLDSGDIVCRQFNPDGSFYGHEWRVNSDPVGALQKEPAVAFGPEDRLYFAWTDYRVPGGQGDIFCKVVTWDEATAVPPEVPPAPLRFALHPAHPNPFNPVTAINYDLHTASRVSLKVYDTAGREVRELVNGWREAGSHQTIFDGSDLPSGVYLLRLEASGLRQPRLQEVRKLILLK